MKPDKIVLLEIDQTGRLLIKPEKKRFTMVYRSAAEVHWDNKLNCLYSPKPREWTYLDWYKHIVSLIETKYNIKLIINETTKWINIPETLRIEIDK